MCWLAYRDVIITSFISSVSDGRPCRDVIVTLFNTQCVGWPFIQRCDNYVIHYTVCWLAVLLARRQDRDVIITSFITQCMWWPPIQRCDNSIIHYTLVHTEMWLLRDSLHSVFDSRRYGDVIVTSYITQRVGWPSIQGCDNYVIYYRVYLMAVHARVW